MDQLQLDMVTILMEKLTEKAAEYRTWTLVTVERIYLPLLLKVICLVQAALLSSLERQMSLQESVHLLLVEELADR